MNLYRLKLRIKYLPIVRDIVKIIKEREFKKIDEVKQTALKESGNILAKKVEKALEEMKLVHFIYFGNLLGLVRDGSFIDYDDDIDYGIIIGNRFNWKELELKLNEHGLKKIRQFSFDGMITEQTYAYQGLSVDLFGCYCNKDVMNSYLYYRKDGYIYNSPQEFHVGRFDYVVVKETIPISFNRVQYYVPANAEELLASIYSENWKVPDKNWDHKKWKNFSELKTIAKGEFFDI